MEATPTSSTTPSASAVLRYAADQLEGTDGTFERLTIMQISPVTYVGRVYNADGSDFDGFFLDLGEGS